MHLMLRASKMCLVLLFTIFFQQSIAQQVTLTATVGTASGTFTTLKGAFDAINSGTHKGDIAIKINATTSETVMATLNASGSGSAIYTSINIYPTTTGLSITGALATPLINLNGADNVTIDGRVNFTGSTKDLIITNTSAVTTAGTSTIRFIGDASSNTVKYCTLKGSTTDAAAGVVFFSTATTTGNDNNTIDNNDITCAADGNRPLNAVYALGTTAKNNDNNTISNNNIYNFLSKATASQGVNIGSYNSGFTISGNSFYETASFTATGVNINYNVIIISAATGAGNGFTVSGNYIGGNTALCAGTAWTKTAQNNAFTAISVTTATGTANSIQGNTIQNINWTNVGTSAFTGISLAGATVANIGTLTGNTIGAATGTGSITFTSTTTATNFYAINIASTDVVDCRNNTIGSVTVANAATNATNFYGIVKTAVAGTTTISNNTIGSTTTASSINASSASSTSTSIQSVYGIQSAGTGIVTISGNTIANMVNATSNTTTTALGLISGIYVSAGTNTISNNTVRDLSNANNNNTITNTASVTGIVMASTAAATQMVSSNTVYKLVNKASTFNGAIIGIYYSGSTTASTVKGNFIHSLNPNLSSGLTSLYGIKIAAGATTYSNNIIYLTGGLQYVNIYGFYETGVATNNNSLFYNTVYISGNVATPSSILSYALYSAVNTNTRNFRNNIFVNTRSSNATSKHYAMYIAASGGTITCNYNNYFVSGTGGVLGYFAADKTALPIVTSNDANSIVTNPTFSSAGGTTADSYIPTVLGTGVTGTGITVDYFGYTRGTSVSMGAYEAMLPPSINSFSPTSAKPGDAVTLTGIRFNTTAANNIVFFGATQATVTAASATSLSLTVPTGATYAPISVLNTGTVLTATSNSNFVPVYSPAKASITSSDISSKVDFTTGSNPNSVAIGDLDGDGKADLAVVNYGSATVSIFRNTSTSGTLDAGSFTTKVDFTTGTQPNSVAIGDLDGDGKPDLAVANAGSATVSVFRNTSTSGSIAAGSFATKVDFTTGANPYSVAIGDLDGDGKPDLAVANFGSATVSVFRNTSTSGSIAAGSFATKVDFTTGTSPYSVAIGDLDGDGKPDLAVANYGSSTVSVFRNTSTSGSIAAGSFATKVDFTTGANPLSVAIGDLDGDGKSDLAVANINSNSVSVFRNTSTSGSLDATSFAAKVDFTIGSVPFTVAIGDLDGDSKLDLATTNSSSANVSVLRNTSTSGSLDATSFAAKVDFATVSGPRSLAIGDLDGDGKADLSVVNYNSAKVSVLRNADCTNPTSGGTIAGAQAVVSGFDPAAFTSSAAASGNSGTLEYKWQSSSTSSSAGFSDIASSNSTTYDAGALTQSTWFKRLARVSCKNDWTDAVESNVIKITIFPPAPVITSFSPTSAKPGDAVTLTGIRFNTTAANNIVFFGATQATVTSASTTSVTVTVPTGATYGPISLLDIESGGSAASLSNFNPIYSPAKASITTADISTKVDFTTGTNPYSVAIGDLDGDGKADLAVVNNTSNSVSVFRNTSTNGSIAAGSFATKVDFTTGSSPYSVAIGDLDGDGKADLAVANINSNSVSVFRNTSTNGSIAAGSFATKVDFRTGSNPISVAIGDLDGDGKPDLAVANSSSATVSIFRNTSTSGSLDATSFAAKVDFTTGSNPISVAIGDLDGDGKSDLSVANSISATVSLFRNTSTSGSLDATSFAAKVDFTTGSSPYSVAIGDLDGDSKPDLATANSSSATVSLFRNTSTSGTLDATSFATKVDFTTGLSPRSVAIGDLDGDGKPDLAVANNNSSTVSVFRNTSTSGSIAAGSFATKVDFTTGTGPFSVAIGDLDGDGKPDLATANYSSAKVSVLRNADCTNPTSGGTIAAAQGGSPGFNPVAFTGSTGFSGYSGTIEYKWQSSITSSSTGFSDIASANAATYDAGTTTQTTWFKRLTRVSCKSDWIGAVESNVLAVTITTCSSPTAGGTIAVAQSGYNPFTPAAFTSIAAASGETGTLEYKWQLSTTSNSTGFSDIASSNSPTYTAGTLTVTTWFKRLARVSCKSDWTSAAESNVLEVTVANCTNPTVGGTIAAAQSGNNPFTPAAFTSSVAASGQTGIIEYKWQSSTSSNTTGFNDIASSNTATYTPGALTVTTWFKRLARVSCKSDWTGAAESNVLEITVTNCTNPTVGGIIATAQSGTNPFTPSAFTSSLAASGETGTLEYKWQSSTTSNSAGFNDIASSNTATYTPGALTVTTWFKRLARVSCKSDWTGAAESNVLEVTIVTLATQPLTQPTNLFFTNTGTSSPYNIVSNFTASTAAGYIVVRKTGTAPSFVPVDGTSYSVGAQGSDEIVYVGSLTSATDYAVTDALSYYYTIYAYNGSGGSINYLTTNPLSGKAINKASNSEAIGNTTQATSVGFPTAGVNISFPNGTSGSTISATKANSIPTSNFSVLPGVRGVVNQYFSITSSNANPGTYTLILDFSSLGLTNGAWNNFKILKRANTTSPWVNITDLGATIANRQTDGIWGKFTITGLTSFSQFTGGAANSTITVTSAAETGTGSLKQAIIDATDGDLINFDVSAMGGNTITLTSQVVINKDLTIQGINGGIILDGNNATRVMDIADTKVVRLERLKIVNGNGNVGYAGGIWNNGDLTMVNCVVSGNKETGNLGVGGILQFSDTGDDPDDVLNLVNCTITANDGTSAVYDDGIGGLSVINGTANIYNTIVYGNTGDGFGDIDQTTVITEIKNSCIGNLSLVTLTNPGVGNIATNPGFVGAIVNATHPYAITNTSPAADAGDNAYNFDATDIRGGAFGRTINKTDGTSGTIDMGAYEFSGCVNPTVGGTIAAAQNGVTPFNPAAFTSTVAASGQSGTVEYKWQSSITSNSAGFSDIASSNADTYDAGALTVTTWYKRLARVTCSADWTGAAESNVIEVTVVSLLPVTGIELGGTASDKQVKLSFKALNEHEMASYTIERSADGTSFTNIGSLQASNANQASASYSFTDNQPIVGNNYYRIKGSSINGQIQYSNVVVVKYGVHVSSVAVVPNPIEGKTLKLKVSQLAKGNYHINVIDALGRSVFKKEMLLDGSGLVQLNLPISAKAGNYYVKVDGQGTVFVQAFIIR